MPTLIAYALGFCATILIVVLIAQKKQTLREVDALSAKNLKLQLDVIAAQKSASDWCLHADAWRMESNTRQLIITSREPPSGPDRRVEDLKIQVKECEQTIARVLSAHNQTMAQNAQIRMENSQMKAILTNQEDHGWRFIRVNVN